MPKTCIFNGVLGYLIVYDQIYKKNYRTIFMWLFLFLFFLDSVFIPFHSGTNKDFHWSWKYVLRGDKLREVMDHRSKNHMGQIVGEGHCMIGFVPGYSDTEVVQQSWVLPVGYFQRQLPLATSSCDYYDLSALRTHDCRTVGITCFITCAIALLCEASRPIVFSGVCLCVCVFVMFVC